ncbi:MAG: hypothetical protein R2764_12155 [Bacteroidales bacterium]
MVISDTASTLAFETVEFNALMNDYDLRENPLKYGKHKWDQIWQR